MKYGDWGLGIEPIPKSPIPNPQSPIPNNEFYIKNNNKIKIIQKKIIFLSNIFIIIIK